MFRVFASKFTHQKGRRKETQNKGKEKKTGREDKMEGKLF